MSPTIGLGRDKSQAVIRGDAVEWALVLLFIVAAIVGIWLWERLVDGATDMLLRAVIWPFATLFGVAKKSEAMRTFRTPQRFQLAATPDRVRETLGQLRSVTNEPVNGRIAPYFLDRRPQCIRIGVGNQLVTPYELEIESTAGWPGTCGELHYLRWDDDPSDDMDIHRALLQDIFGSLGALDSMLHVTTEPITIDTETPLPDPASGCALIRGLLDIDLRPQVWVVGGYHRFSVRVFGELRIGDRKESKVRLIASARGGQGVAAVTNHVADC
jgi:hypothetical protein